MIKNTHKVLVLVATGFEDIELITTLDIFARNKINYTLVSVENKWEVQGKYNAIVKTTPIKEVDISQFTSLFLPGGPGYEILLDNIEVIDIVKNFAQEKKLISAICAAPEVLLKADVIGDKKFTSYPKNAQVKNNTGQPLEIAPHLITARDYLVTVEFAQAVVKHLKD